MYEKEKIIKEQRTAEAVSKNYMGKNGKLGVILNCFGKPVLEQGGSNYDQTFLEDPYDIEYDDKLPELDQDMLIIETGKVFDGLKFGHHIEISYMKNGTIPVRDENGRVRQQQAEKVIKILYKGYYVYVEAENELVMFTPFKEWENIIETIYKAAEKIGKRMVEDIQEIVLERDREEKLSFLQKLRELWGI